VTFVRVLSNANKQVFQQEYNLQLVRTSFV